MNVDAPGVGWVSDGSARSVTAPDLNEERGLLRFAVLKCAFCHGLGYGSVDAFTVVDGHATCRDHFMVSFAVPPHWRFAEIMDRAAENSRCGKIKSEPPLPCDVPDAPGGASGDAS